MSTRTDKPAKPLGRRCYGSIGHLPGSRRGPGDHGVNEGMARILTERPRDKHDFIVVQEKLDGSNVGVAKVGGQIHAIGRAGYPAWSSPHEQHHLFAHWVQDNAYRFEELLNEGERVCGEWLAQAHGTRYDLRHDPFVAFDLIHGAERVTHDEFLNRTGSVMLTIPRMIHSGYSACSIQEAIDFLGVYGHHGAVDPCEGAVWRVERRGKVDFLAKYVRPDKVDGCYLPEISGCEPVWNWRAWK